jgi:hypothetical protein
MTDVKHLGLQGPDHIERDILAQELIYLNTQMLTSPANLHAQKPVGSPK